MLGWSNRPFKKNNIYKYNDVEYELSSNVGVILFYNNESSGTINNNIIHMFQYNYSLMVLTIIETCHNYGGKL